MLITIAGAHCTGKSTLIEELKKNKNLSDAFEFKGEVLREIKRSGIKINEYGTNETQMMVLSKMLQYATLPNAILDRGFLDCLVYTTYLYEQNQVSQKIYELAKNMFENIRYDMYFYIPPEFDIIPDGVRSENFDFRNRIVQLFEYYIELYKLNVIYLRGDIPTRANTFIQEVNEYRKSHNI